MTRKATDFPMLFCLWGVGEEEYLNDSEWWNYIFHPYDDIDRLYIDHETIGGE